MPDVVASRRTPVGRWTRVIKPTRAWLFGTMAVLPATGRAQTPDALHMTYDTFAAGLQVAQVEAGFGLGPHTYQVNLAYHTTGLAGLFDRGHQLNTVHGSWNGVQPVPEQFFGAGVWRGQQRVAQIDYANGVPTVRQLVPPNEAEREIVPNQLQVNSIDTLSALAELIHNVDLTGRCETVVRTYDGRRATEIRATTGGHDMLQPSGRSSFAGPALRCDFAGHLLSGSKFGADREQDARPLHGSAWLASAVPGGPAVPVRLTFETRWFGEATMYLTSVSPGFELSADARQQ